MNALTVVEDEDKEQSKRGFNSMPPTKKQTIITEEENSSVEKS